MTSGRKGCFRQRKHLSKSLKVRGKVIVREFGSVSLSYKRQGGTGKVQDPVMPRGWVTILTCMVSLWKVSSRRGIELGFRNSILVWLQEMGPKETELENTKMARSPDSHVLIQVIWKNADFSSTTRCHLPSQPRLVPGTLSTIASSTRNISGSLVPSHVFPLTHSAILTPSEI